MNITPLILTYNEGPNIRRTLERLTWAKRVLIVDSFSTDETLNIISEFPNAEVLQRPFDRPSNQCNFGLEHITTLWTLSLDADYICPTGLPAELQTLNSESCGYNASFRYCVYGKPLRATLYPPRVVLYQTAKASYYTDGHTQRVRVDGQIDQLRSVIDHDDRKSLARWLISQTKYAAQEADKILNTSRSSLGWKDRLRLRVIFAPALTVIYCLLLKGLIFDGRVGIYYTVQRMYAELLLSLEILDRRLNPAKATESEKLSAQTGIKSGLSAKSS